MATKKLIPRINKCQYGQILDSLKFNNKMNAEQDSTKRQEMAEREVLKKVNPNAAKSLGIIDSTFADYDDNKSFMENLPMATLNAATNVPVIGNVANLGKKLYKGEKLTGADTNKALAGSVAKFVPFSPLAVYQAYDTVAEFSNNNFGTNLDRVDWEFKDATRNMYHDAMEEYQRSVQPEPELDQYHRLLEQYGHTD